MNPIPCPDCGGKFKCYPDCHARCEWWRQLALTALSDLQMVGVPIEAIRGVDDDVLEMVEDHQRQQTSYS